MILENYTGISVCLVLFMLIRIGLTRNKKIIVSSLSVSLIIGSLMILQASKNTSNLNGNEQYFDLVVKATSVKIDGDRLRFVGKTLTNGQNSENLVITYKIKSNEEKERLISHSFPKFLALSGNLTRPDGMRNINQFDYKTYLMRNQTHWIFEVDEIEVNKGYSGHYPISYRVDHLRADLFNVIDRRIQGKAGDYIKALLFADKRNMSDSTMENYRALGIVHLLSISGLHIQFLIKLIKKILLEIGVTRETANMVLLILLPVYALLAGLGISVFRAVVQTLLSILFTILNKLSSSLDNWAITLLLALAIQPYHLYSAGFQLSYLLSFTMILLSSHPNIIGLTKLKQSLYLNCAISLVSLPILSYHFFEFTWIVVLLNLIFLPLFSFIILPMLVAVLIVSLIFPQTALSSLTITTSNNLLRVLEEGIRTISEASHFTFVVGRLSVLGMILLCIGIIIILLEREMKGKKYQYRLLLLGSIFLLSSLFSERFSPIGKVMMIDVGQGDALMIKEPYGRGNYLIDTGGVVEWQEKEEWTKRNQPYSVGDDIVLPVLKSQGVARINQIYLTHADADHVGALKDIVNGMKVDEIVATPLTLEDQSISQYLSLFKQKEITLRPIYAEGNRSIGPNLIPLYPKEKMSRTASNKNEVSLVLYGKIGRYHWLFTGDLESEGEEELLALYPNLKIDVLKVGHHGSLTSSQEKFLDGIKPNIGWISSGKNNIYGHPHPEILNRLNNREIKIYRTDQKGSILYQYYKRPFSNQIRDEIYQVN
ncbi:DNA internalization-related competence protein ComEC/Rec2 [Marinilactibacillus kalidii]|uniref:DNA internalization-related competence protein ComEC/Rec2 n=1 Tax=Marinilactibacillus kalidii TaxID=2820274 RepID=UPI0024478FFD|nr:DNA internalization-related competence protein ComEC/Rec2 [Marinilactibacillus kalidii]